MCKMDKRKFTVSDRDYNSDTLIKLNERRNAHKSKKYSSIYITVIQVSHPTQKAKKEGHFFFSNLYSDLFS
jgi:hypothetical protein